jgi:hypothetical protein
VVYSKFPEKQRKPTGMTWFTHKESGRQYVRVTGTGEGVYLVTENVDTDAEPPVAVEYLVGEGLHMWAAQSATAVEEIGRAMTQCAKAIQDVVAGIRAAAEREDGTP